MKRIRWVTLVAMLAVFVGLGPMTQWSHGGSRVALASTDCVSGAGGLNAYYFDGSYGTLNLSGGQPWVMTLTDIDGSAVTGNKTYMFMIQDQGSGSGWEFLPTQVHHAYYGAGGHLLQSDDGWTVRSSHGFNPGDVPGTFDLRVVMQQRDDHKWDISPYFRLPGGDWTLFYDGSWTTATAFDLTKTRLAVGIDAGAGGTLCFTPPTADGVDLSNVYVDDDWAGTDPNVEVESGKFFGLNAFAVIQDGIDAVTTGGTVDVADGIYTATSLASVVIAKDGLSLVGESRDGTIIDGGTWGTSSAGWPKGIHVYANDVTIRNLTVRGFTGDTVDTGGYGIVFRDWAHDTPGEGYIFYSGGLVEDVKLEDNYSSMYALVHRNLTVHDSLIQDSLADGMFIARESDNATVTGNTVLNSGNHGIWVGYCWSGLGPSDNATITENVVDGAIEGGISFVASNGAVISGNDVSHVKGEEPEGDFGGWSRGAISLKDGVSNVTVSNNVVHDNDGLGTGSGRGIGVDGTSSNITLTGNIIRDNAGGGIKVMGTTSGWVASYNSIYGNTSYGAQNTTGSLLDFTGNWWGSDSGPQHASNTFNVGAQGDAVSNNVLFVPWLDDAPPGGTSFAPVTTTNPVGSYASIQAGINASNAGGDVNAKAGTYTESLNVVSRSDINVVGESRDTTIVKPATTFSWAIPGMPQYDSRKAAVRVYGSTAIDFSGFTFDFDLVKGNNVAGLFYWDSTGVISGNALKNMSVADAAGGYYELTSYVRAPSYTDGARAEVQFIENVFTDTGRLGIVTHDFVHATIQGNTFTKTTDDFGYAMEIGSRSTATVTGNTISGNDTPAASDGSTAAGIYIENSFTGGLPHIVKPVTVSGNTITGNQYGVWIGNEYTGYAGDIDINVTLQGNTISDNTDGGVYIVDEGRSVGSSVTVNASGNDVIDNGDVGYWFNTYGDGELHVDVRNDTITGHGWGAVMTDYPSGTSNSLYDVSINLSDLSANTVGAENGVAGKTLDATGNWWGDASGPNNATNNSDGTGSAVSDDVAYSPWLGIGTDTSGDPGFQPASPMTFIVEPQVCLPVGCIQRAVNLASGGDTIQVKAGTYNEQVIINKSLTVNGAGQGVTVIAPSLIAVNSTRLGGSSPGSGVAGIIVVDTTTDVTIRDLTVDGSGNALTVCDPPALFGVYWRNGSGTIEGSEVRNIEWGSGHEGCQGAIGIFAESGGTGSTSVTIDGNSVHDVQKNGISANGAATTATISGNTVAGWGPTDKIAQNGIQIGYGAGGSITGNEASGYDYTPSDWAATGILVTQAKDGVVVSGNNVHDNMEGLFIVNYSTPTMKNLTVSGNTVTDTRDVGVYLLLVEDSEVSNNAISSSGYGLYLADSSGIAAKLNTISGNGDGVVIDGDSQDDTFTDNKITNNTRTGVSVAPYYAEPSGLVFRLNQIAGNGTYGIENTSANIVDALSNWWGHATGPKHPTTNPTGQGNKVSDRVLFNPWVKAIEYVGDRSIVSGGVANLRARFVNSDNTSPAVAGIQVYFDLLASGGIPVPGSPFSALTQSNGVATATVSGLGVGVYTVISRWDPLADTDMLGVFGTGDTDSDGIIDVLDNCPAVYNPDQTNTDAKPIDNGPVLAGDDLTVPYSDGYGDACDPDDDNDWMSDELEAIGCGSGPTNPLVQDTDGDKVIDGAECLLGSDPNNPNSVPVRYPPNDSDDDGIPANVEALLGSSDSKRDTDGDGISDSIEFMGWGTLPGLKDSNSNSCGDNIEIADVNGDGWVDSSDYQILAQRFAKARDDDFDPDPPWNFSPAFDVSRDGRLDSGDLYLVAKNMVRSCQ